MVLDLAVTAYSQLFAETEDLDDNFISLRLLEQTLRRIEY